MMRYLKCDDCGDGAMFDLGGATPDPVHDCMSDFWMPQIDHHHDEDEE